VASGFKYLDQTADARVYAWGESLEEVFHQAFLGMINIMVETSTVKPTNIIKIEIEGDDDTSLLYNLLSEVLFIIETKGVIPHDIDRLCINKGRLTGAMLVDILDGYALHGEVKAVTYHDIFVREANGRFEAQVVLDL